MASTDPFRSALDQFTGGILDALPEILAAVVFLGLAYVVIRVVRRLLRAVLERTYPTDQHAIVDFVMLVVTVFLWFAVLLVLLKVLGMGEIAASLGTATGFVALGVSYALSDMVEDTVAGVYLLRDPDFNPGDTVSAGGTTGTVTSIGLRKSRFELDNGDTVIAANRTVEAKWTKLQDATGANDV